MTSRDDFADSETLVKYLASQLQRGRLALILGAGLSVPFGLPDWIGLINRLYEMQGANVPPGQTPPRLAEYFRVTYFPRDKPGYIRAVQQALYRGVNADFEVLRKNDTLAAIASLIMAPRRGSTSEVYTFNFDNLLEIFLNYHGFVTASLSGARFWAGYADARVCHPHGMLPFDRGHACSEDIVFDQASYSAVVGKESDPWHQRMRVCMAEHTCLFIGLSGRDVNLDSLLHAVRDKHASRDDNTAFWGVSFSAGDEKVDRTIWEERGVFVHQLRSYEDLGKFLFGICQEAAKQAR